jgi:hypothetical protein
VAGQSIKLDPEEKLEIKVVPVDPLPETQPD